MLTVFSDRQTAHAPLRELNNGEWMDFAESPDRMDSILSAIGAVTAPQDHGDAAILAVHDADYVEFLRSAHQQWLAEGRTGDAIGYTFPVVHRRTLPLERIDAKMGLYGFDAATPIASGTFDAAYWSAQSTLSALEAIKKGNTTKAFALCRPPGHHAGRDYCGGYCYFNNAAIAAEQARAKGMGPVAVIDVDYHHGNGTQDIFYADGEVFFASLHADPVMDFPYYWGHADETGIGEGVGATLNLPLPRGTSWVGYEQALAKALEAIAAFGARVLIVSYGADTFIDDPISYFAMTTGDMHRMGAAISGLEIPTLTVMEGGYRIDALGKNVGAFLEGVKAG